MWAMLNLTSLFIKDGGVFPCMLSLHLIGCGTKLIGKLHNGTMGSIMTRINLVPPQELMDQHLFAEFREIKMVPKSLRRSLRAAWQKEFDKNDSNEFSEQRAKLAMDAVLKKIPKSFTLNTGHVSFFYDKSIYLEKRYESIIAELRKRGINFNEQSRLDPDGIFMEVDNRFRNDYVPTKEALFIIRSRIAEKIAMKPDWYRYTGS